MYEKKQSKLIRSIAAGLCAAVMLAYAGSGGGSQERKLSLFFPGFILGGAIDRGYSENDDPSPDDTQNDIVFAFRIGEILKSIFG